MSFLSGWLCARSHPAVLALATWAHPVLLPQESCGQCSELGMSGRECSYLLDFVCALYFGTYRVNQATSRRP